MTTIVLHNPKLELPMQNEVVLVTLTDQAYHSHKINNLPVQVPNMVLVMFHQVFNGNEEWIGDRPQAKFKSDDIYGWVSAKSIRFELSSITEDDLNEHDIHVE